jgi:acetoacetate decarboxylase
MAIWQHGCDGGGVVSRFGMKTVPHYPGNRRICEYVEQAMGECVRDDSVWAAPAEHMFKTNLGGTC